MSRQSQHLFLRTYWLIGMLASFNPKPQPLPMQKHSVSPRSDFQRLHSLVSSIGPMFIIAPFENTMFLFRRRFAPLEITRESWRNARLRSISPVTRPPEICKLFSRPPTQTANTRVSNQVCVSNWCGKSPTDTVSFPRYRIFRVS